MKKSIFVLLMFFCLIGCQTIKTEFKNVNNISELTNVIENNEVVDYLVISDWSNPLNELNNWIQKTR